MKKLTKNDLSNWHDKLLSVRTSSTKENKSNIPKSK